MRSCLHTGLVDEGETPEQAAFRELEEETGYKAQKVLETSPLMVPDPGSFLSYIGRQGNEASDNHPLEQA